MPKAREPQVFTVRNSQGQFMGAYRVLTSEQAIDRVVSAQAAYQAHFRGHAMPLNDLVASVEPAA